MDSQIAPVLRAAVDEMLGVEKPKRTPRKRAVTASERIREAREAGTLDQLADALKKQADAANWHASSLPRRIRNTDEERHTLEVFIESAETAVVIARAIVSRL